MHGKGTADVLVATCWKRQGARQGATQDTRQGTSQGTSFMSGVCSGWCGQRNSAAATLSKGRTITPSGRSTGRLKEMRNQWFPRALGRTVPVSWAGKALGNGRRHSRPGSASTTAQVTCRRLTPHWIRSPSGDSRPRCAGAWQRCSGPRALSAGAPGTTCPPDTSSLIRRKACVRLKLHDSTRPRVSSRGPVRKAP